jgi:signal transduction histidine kinase
MPRLFRSLQFRLAAAFVLWTALFQLALVLGVPLIRESFVYEQIDLAIVDEALGIPEGLATLDGPPAEVSAIYDLMPGERPKVPAEFIAQLRDAHGNLIDSSENLGGTVLPFNPPPPRIPPSTSPVRETERPASFQTATIPALNPVEGREDQTHRVRVATYRIEPAGGGEPYYLQLGMSLEIADRTNAFLRLSLLAAMIAGTVGAGIAGWIVAGAIVSRIKRIAGAVRDVSPTRLEERIELPEGDDEVGRMAAEVNAMLHRMAVAVQSHERFLSHVSHELKTPVSALLTEAQVLKYRRPDEKAYESFVLSVEDEMRRLGRMVESFLMLARFGHGRRFLAETTLPINDIALESVEHSSMLAWQHGVTLNLTLYDPGENKPEALVRGDTELIRVVVDNLIRNAVQHSKAGNKVQVIVDASDTHVSLAVLDEGPGIPEEYLDKIFDRFVQAPSVPDAGRRGTGLGLTIAKGVVDLHGGTIRVENRPDHGCAFIIRLPIATQPGHLVPVNGKLTVVPAAEAVPSPR